MLMLMLLLSAKMRRVHYDHGFVHTPHPHSFPHTLVGYLDRLHNNPPDPLHYPRRCFDVGLRARNVRNGDDDKTRA